MTFDEALNTHCTKCGARAMVHRMGSSGQLYCLELNDTGQRVRDYNLRNWNAWEDRNVYWIHTKYLRRGGFEPRIGKAIKRGLTTYVESR